MNVLFFCLFYIISFYHVYGRSVRNASLLPQHFEALPPPKLECSSDGIQLHIQPNSPFKGHVYVSGFFSKSVCHINHSRDSTNSSFTMRLGFRGDCNIRRRRNIDPPSIIYDATVIVQHHPLFVTSYDKAYRLNCVYRRQDTIVEQKLNISDIEATTLQGKSSPQCRYDVLAGSLHGPIVRFANVGDTLVHRWTCNDNDYGFLVHSCSVRDDTGNDYQFVDERGCPTDPSLFPELRYGKSLNEAFTITKAFRYADQVMVHFSCQITICKKTEQGCEGITPPLCKLMDLGPIKVQYPNDKKASIDNKQISTKDITEAQPVLEATTYESVRVTTTEKDLENIEQTTFAGFTNSYSFPNQPSNELYHNAAIDVQSEPTEYYGLEIKNEKMRLPIIAEQEKMFADNNGRRVEDRIKTETLVSLMEPESLPFPSKAFIFTGKRATRGINDSLKPTNVTLDVESKIILLLNADEFQLNNNDSPDSSIANQFISTQCGSLSVFKKIALFIMAFMQILSIIVILIQRYSYNMLLNKYM